MDARSITCPQTGVRTERSGHCGELVQPGFTATDLNAHRGQQTVAKGAAEIVRVGLQAHGPSGKFLETGGELVW